MILKTDCNFHLQACMHPSRVNEITDISMSKMTGIKRAYIVRPLWLVIEEKLNWNSHFKLLKGKVGADLSSLT